MSDKPEDRLVVLPLSVLTREGFVPFDADRALAPGDVVYAIGRRQPVDRSRSLEPA